MNVTSLDTSALRDRLQRIYGPQTDTALALIVQKLTPYENTPPAIAATSTHKAQRWSERDVVLITYGGQVRSVQQPGNKTEQETPLQAQLRFLQQWQLLQLINTIHFLPFFPYSSDDGFSVIDYRTVDPALGTWEDVRAIGNECQLMFDFVVNHVSQQSKWFQDYLAGLAPYDRFFIEVSPDTDVAGVTRPRSLPLLHEFQTSRGPKWVWTTFSRDQVDLNYRAPELLAEVIGILLEYVGHGARIIRLDAIAYLWKELGTPCIHLPQTHEVVRVFRDVLAAVAPDVLLLTETNVRHDENVSYFGDGDEAHMVYQFSLPPLLLDAFVHHNAVPIKNWLANLANPAPGTTYFNFTASHDGIGVRPLEGHVDAQRLENLVSRVRQNGGHVSTRRCADGSDAPYELNISYLDALADEHGDRNQQVRRFLATQAVMLALQGMPAIYFHSLVGTPSDHAGVEQSGIPRRINRRKFDIGELNDVLNTPGSLQNVVFEGIQKLIRVRIEQPAFHPDADQTYIASELPEVLAFQRDRHDAGQHILVVVNFGATRIGYDAPGQFSHAVDLLDPTSAAKADGRRWDLDPAQVRWLVAKT